MCVPCVGAALHWIVVHLDRGAVTTSQAKPPSAGTHCVQSPKVLREAGVAKVLDAAISRTDKDNGSTEPAMRDVILSWVSDIGNGLGPLFSELATSFSMFASTSTDHEGDADGRDRDVFPLPPPTPALIRTTLGTVSN